MKNRLFRQIGIAALAALFVFPMVVSAAEDAEAPSGPPPKAPAKPSQVKLLTEGEFTSLQIGNTVYVYNSEGQIFKTAGVEQSGPLLELFTVPLGPEQVPLILVNNKENGWMVFSDLWPKLADKEQIETDNDTAYDAGRIYAANQTKFFSKTKHHYGEQIGTESVVYTANDFDNLDKGYHESIRVEGSLRGLILYDCCPYLVVENADKELIVYHAGEGGAEVAGKLDL